MTTKTLAQTLVTVHTVRAANARMITIPHGESRPHVQSPKVAAKIRDVDSSGQYPMQHTTGKK